MKAYTIGIPIATVLFLSLLIGSLFYIGSNKQPKTELKSESAAVLTDLRDQLAFIPRVNADKTAVTTYLDADPNVTTIRVHGLMSRDLQTKLRDHLATARQSNNWRPVVIHFHYPEQRPPSSPGQELIEMPTHTEHPQPFRTEKL